MADIKFDIEFTPEHKEIIFLLEQANMKYEALGEHWKVCDQPIDEFQSGINKCVKTLAFNALIKIASSKSNDQP